MAAIAAEAATSIGLAFSQQIGQAIGGAITNGSQKDKDDRASFLSDVYNQVAPSLNGKHLIIVYPDHDASGLACSDGSPVVHKPLPVKRPSGQTLTYQLYSFDYGTFKLKGDGGSLNWIFDAPQKGFSRPNSGTLIYDKP